MTSTTDMLHPQGNPYGKLRPDFKKRWLAGLRSEFARQGSRYLSMDIDGVEYDCPMGVALGIAVQDGVCTKRLLPPENDLTVYEYSFQGHASHVGVVPDGLTYWAYKIYPRPDLVWCLRGDFVAHLPVPHMSITELNDIRDLTFAEIADLIEAQL